MPNLNINNKTALIFVLLLGILTGTFLFYLFYPAQCSVDYYSFPSDDSGVINLINNAHDKIFIEMYVFTNKDIMQALADADARGVDVRIILEKSIDINNNAYVFLKSKGVDVRWSGGDYRVTHAKLMIIDNKTFIGSPNFSYSAFHRNREFAVLLSCTKNQFETEFYKDWGMAG